MKLWFKIYFAIILIAGALVSWKLERAQEVTLTKSSTDFKAQVEGLIDSERELGCRSAYLYFIQTDEIDILTTKQQQDFNQFCKGLGHGDIKYDVAPAGGVRKSTPLPGAPGVSRLRSAVGL